MKLEYKKKIKAKLIEMAPRYNMPDIVFPSFAKKYGYLTSFSACDTVYALSALLDAGDSWIQRHGTSSYEIVMGLNQASGGSMTQDTGEFDSLDRASFGDGGLVGAGVGTLSHAGTVAAQVLDAVSQDPSLGRDSDWIRNFFVALDALERCIIF